jgi:dihydroorotate dehydrogenase
MIRLSNNHKMEYVVASGALGFYGEGWPWDRPFMWVKQLDPSFFTVFCKTVTYKERKGNLKWYWPFGCIRLVGGLSNTRGVLNSVGLTNPGCLHWFAEFEMKRNPRVSLAASILAEGPKAVKEIREMLSLTDGLMLVAVEINASCPNTGGDILENTKQIIDVCQEAKRISRHPLVLKLSVVHNIREILPEIKGAIEAISINSVPWRVIFPKYESPLAHLGGGGLSGKTVQCKTWKFAQQISDLTDIPVIWPGMWDCEDIELARKKGAKTVSFGSIFLRYPWRPCKFVRKDMKNRGVS